MPGREYVIQESETKCLDITDPLYPGLLKEIRDPPKCLFYKGEWKGDLFEKCLAVVGSRKISDYGVRVTEHILGVLGQMRVTVVSGFMRGVDYYAHLSALNSNLPTIAVLPCGIEDIYPVSHRDIASKILDAGGLVVSEYPGRCAPKDWMFVKRNRIVAGLSHGLLLIEAAENSGSLITFNYAKRFKRVLMAVPGDIFNVNQQGVRQALYDGAEPVFSGEDVVNKMRLVVDSKDSLSGAKNGIAWSKAQLVNEDGDLGKVVIKLKETALSLETLSQLTDIEISKLTIIVTRLEISGQVRRTGGKYYAS